MKIKILLCEKIKILNFIFDFETLKSDKKSIKNLIRNIIVHEFARFSKMTLFHIFRSISRLFHPRREITLKVISN